LATPQESARDPGLRDLSGKAHRPATRPRLRASLVPGLRGL